MAVYHSIDELPDAAKGGAVVIGNFDGVHLGHQAILGEAKEKIAQTNGGHVIVLTFEPHPKSLFRPDDPPFRINSPDSKYDALKACGADLILALPFDWTLASLSAEDFIERYLKPLSPACIIVGEDFRFGQLRKGTVDTLIAAGFKVDTLKPQTGNTGNVYSSSAVRRFLQDGDIASANAILGRPWEIMGEIVRGDRRGHDLGYPTANVHLGGILHPAYGIYAAWTRIESEKEWRMAAVNIGIRPMFEVKVGQIEAHILDMEDRDLYGLVLHVRPHTRLRGEAKFASLEELIQQMNEDCRQAKNILSQDKRPAQEA